MFFSWTPSGRQGLPSGRRRQEATNQNLKMSLIYRLSRVFHFHKSSNYNFKPMPFQNILEAQIHI
jgi:hypothetical protein